MCTIECEHCGDHFDRRSQNPTQRYCSKPECQRARKTHWEREKRRTDPDYRENRRRSQRAWTQRHPDYWRRWREQHPEYVERNRQQQQKRNRRARNPPECADAATFAKVDASNGVSPIETLIPTGTYRILSVDPSALGELEGSCKGGRVDIGFICEIKGLSGCY